MYSISDIKTIFKNVKTEEEWEKVIEIFIWLNKNHLLMWSKSETEIFKNIAANSLLSLP